MRRKMLVIPILMLLSLTIFTGCSTAGYGNISTDEAKEMLDKDPENVILIDVRTEEEYAQGHAPQAKLYPLDSLEQSATELDKDLTYLVICRSGNRSQTASDILVKQGFSDVYNVEGGMNTWTYDIVTGP